MDSVVEDPEGLSEINERLIKRLEMLADQLDGIVWPNHIFDGLQDVHTEILDIAAEIRAS